MTAPTPFHLDLDALADVLADQAPDVATSHLGRCASCASRLAELEAAEARVIAVLSTLPPPDVPADLADRLTAALAAEAPLAGGRATATTGASVTALPTGRPHRTWLPAAAAAVLLVSGAGIGWSLLSGGGGSDSAGDEFASSAPEVVVSSTGTDYADTAAVTAALPGVLSGQSARAYAESGAAAGATGDSADNDPAGSGAAASAEVPTAATLTVADPLARLRTAEGLADCLAGLQATPEEEPLQPLAVDFATYGGAPALAVLLTDPDPTKLSVFVVGPQCAQADAQLLHFVRVDAP